MEGDGCGIGKSSTLRSTLSTYVAIDVDLRYHWNMHFTVDIKYEHTIPYQKSLMQDHSRTKRSSRRPHKTCIEAKQFASRLGSRLSFALPPPLFFFPDRRQPQPPSLHVLRGRNVIVEDPACQETGSFAPNTLIRVFLDPSSGQARGARTKR